MTFVDVTMTDSWATKGGTMYLTHGASISMTNSTLSYSQSIFEGGFIMVYEQSAFTLIGLMDFQYCSFKHMWSGKNGGILYISSSEIELLNIYETTVYNATTVTSACTSMILTQEK
jgi:hypothetical protein